MACCATSRSEPDGWDGPVPPEVESVRADVSGPAPRARARAPGDSANLRDDIVRADKCLREYIEPMKTYLDDWERSA
jgi:hypothetical protein